MNQDVVEALHSRTLQSDEDSCWLWLGKTTMRGYGQIGAGGKSMYAHRVAYTVHHGPIEDGQVICHTCDNPSCVNPSYLFAGSQRDNLRDMATKGRSTHGERNHQAKLTASDVEAIFALRELGLTQAVIAQRFNVQRTAISRILSGARWATARKVAA